METAIYVDVLLAVNLVVNYLLLLGGGRLSGRVPRGPRLIAAALVGALSSLVIFWSPMGFWTGGLYKLSVSAAMVLIAFPAGGVRRFIIDLFFLFAVSFIFAGGMLAFWIFISPENMLIYNGVVYFGFDALTLIALTAVCYTAVEVLGRLRRRIRTGGEIGLLQIGAGGKVARVKVLMDNGSALAEPFSDIPVIVCWERPIAAVVPDQMRDLMEGRPYVPDDFAGLHIRLIPFRAVGKKGVLPAFRPDSAHLLLEGRRMDIMPVYIAVSADRIGTEVYHAVANPQILRQQGLPQGVMR
jgi:stage II sporulation protein GA (sporulation sigma-E factor processing peptidase)